MSDVPGTEPLASAVERRIVSVLFADLVGFTPIAERLDSEDVATIQDSYFAAVRETVERYGGVLEKFIGDAAMAVFGIPAGRDDDAERAVRAGLALLGAIEQLGARLGLAPGELQLRVGVNSGEVVHAISGPDVGRVTGDTVNTAARLQTAAEPGTVLLGELTALSVAAGIETEPMGAIELKGKAEPVRCWTAIGARPEPSREEALGALRGPMLGRREELDRLASAVADTARGRAAARLVILAAPGIGKSRLLRELADTLEPSGVAVLRARVRPQATAPYETVAQLVRAAGRLPELGALLHAAGVPADRATVVEAEVAALLEGAPPLPASGSDLAAERDRRFGAWIEALDALAGRKAAWLVEDIHWAGGDLLAFLDLAGRSPAAHGRAVVVTARPSLLETAPAWFEGAHRLDLAALPPADAAGLVEALIGTVLPGPLVEAIVERSDGTPLFIEELLRTWASVGTLVREADGWRLAVEPDAVPLPPTVQAIYAAQLDDLPPDARLVARRGAVAGRRVPTAALAALGIEGTDGLERLRRRALLDGPLEDELTGPAYAYRHALLRDAGYASLARAERSRLHVAMAGWLAAVAGDRAGIVAEAIAEHHVAAIDSLPSLPGGDLPARDHLAAEAAAWSERAADGALSIAAHEAAVRLFRQAIDHTPSDSGLDLSRRRRRLGEVLAATADLDAGIGELEAALEAGAADPASLAASAHALARAYMQQIRFAEAERVTANALARLAGGPDDLRPRLHALHAWAVAAQGREEGVVEEATAAREQARRAGDPLLELDVLEHAALALEEVDASSVSDWAELEERARRFGRWQQVVAAARIVAVHESAEDPEAALGRLAGVAEIARAQGLVEQAGWCEYARCELLWVLGRWDDAQAVGEAVVELAERNAYERLAFRTWVVLMPIAAERRLAGMADRFARWRTRNRAHFPSAPSPYGRLLNGAIDAWIEVAHGRTPAAPPSDLVEAIVPMMNPHYLAGVEAVVAAWLANGRGDLAVAVADRLAAFEDPTPLMRTSRALVEAWTGRIEPGMAVEAAHAADAPWWLSRALRAAGREAEAIDVERGLGATER